MTWSPMKWLQICYHISSRRNKWQHWQQWVIGSSARWLTFSKSLSVNPCCQDFWNSKPPIFTTTYDICVQEPVPKGLGCCWCGPTGSFYNGRAKEICSPWHHAAWALRLWGAYNTTSGSKSRNHQALHAWKRDNIMCIYAIYIQYIYIFI